tara:strand:+ start:251 stop:460 length:210 start_codon:yes stop_codon:yes gene_type:complete
MGIIIGVLMLTLGILFLHKIILSVFGLMFGLLIASLAILISIVSFAFVAAMMVIVGVLCVIGLIISILI